MALWTPQDEPTLSCWIDASDASARIQSGSSISQLTDKSGNSNHANDAVNNSNNKITTARPTQISSGLNGLDVVGFNGSQWFDHNSAKGLFRAKSASLVFMVFKYGVVNNSEFQFSFANRISVTGGDTPVRVQFLHHQGNTGWFLGASGAASDTSTSVNATSIDAGWHIHCANIANAAGYLEYLIDDHSIGENQFPIAGNTSDIDMDSLTGTRTSIGAFNRGGGLPVTNGSRLAELLVFTIAEGTYDDDLIRRVNGYLAWKWGLESNLPANHPYKDAAPETAPTGDIGEGNLVEIIQQVNDATDIVGEGDLITISQVVNITASGNVVLVSQTVGRFGAGNLTKLEQAVDLRLTGKGGLVALGQTVNATTTAGQGNLTRIAQSVRATLAPTEYEPPFDLELIVGDLTIPANQIHGSISITRSESSAALMDVTLIPPKGAQNITQYQGKDIILNYIADGVSTRIYTGKVDIPEVDIMGQTITLRCTDNRTEQNNALNPVFVQGIGQYSEAVFGEAKDQNDQIEKRLQTVQASLDYDANGLVTFTQWQPKAVADFVFDDPDIYRRTPQVEVLSRGRVINTVNLELTYRWVRLRHRERDWSWRYPFEANDWCGFLVDNIGLCPVDAPRRAAEGAGWAIKPDTYSTEPLPRSNWYRCTIGNLVNRPIGWQTSKRTCTFVDKLNDAGEVVKDSEGKTVMVEDRCTIVDGRFASAIAADWSAAKRWAQTVEQVSRYIITAPQSIAQYGVVERDQRVGTESEYDATTWEAMRTYQLPKGTKSANGDWVIDRTVAGQGGFNSAVSCVRAKAVADILGSHRQNYVTLQLPFQRSIDLRHTIETTAGKIQCKGKAYSIRHTLDVGDKFAETEIQIALSRSTGSASNSLPTINMTPATDPQTSNLQPIRLGNWVGGRGGVQLPGYEFGSQPGVNMSDRTESGLPKGAQGFITNYRYNRPQPLFTESFIVDTPAIEDAARNTLTTESEQSATVAIRNDHLEVIFDE